MKKFITVAALLAAGTAFANAAVVANYDVSSVTDDDIATTFSSGGFGAYYGFSFTLPETIDGITAGTQLSLDSITFARGDSGNTTVADSAYLNVFSSNSLSESTFIGQSSSAANTSRVGSGSPSSNVAGKFETVSFSGVTLKAGNTYSVFFSSTQITDTYTHTGAMASLRLGKAGANELSGSDVVYSNAAGTSTQSGDWLPIYSVSVSAIPEPSAFGLLAGAGAFVLVAARRRRSK